MHRRVQALAAGAALTALLGLAACDDRQPSTPTAPDTPALAPTASPCDFSAIKQAASKYLSNKTRDTFYGTVTDQQAAYNLVGRMSQASDPARTGYGFDLLALIARVANTGRQIGSPAQGSALAYATLRCTAYAAEATSTGQFTDALGVAGTDVTSKARGVFGVRGGDATQGSPDPATAAIVAKRATASVPLTWGVETPLGLDGSTPLAWSAVLGAANLSPSRILIYGVQTGATFPDRVVAGTQPIDVKAIPAAATFTPYLVVAYCDVDAGAAHALIEHLNTGTTNPLIPVEIPPFVAPRFCASPPPASVGLLPPGERTPLRLARALAGWGLDLLRPAPLQAMLLKSGAGGGKGSVSPFAVVDAGTLQFGYWDLATSRFAHTLGDATTTTKLPEFAVAVLSALPSSTPLAAVNVRITVTGNSGSFTLYHGGGAGTALPGATYVLPSGPDGIVHFSTATDSLRLDKPGGYTIKAELDGNQTQLTGIQPVDFSNLFHITQ